MKLNSRNIIVTGVAAAIMTVVLSGCAPSDERLAELTGGKNLNQIKQGYLMSMAMEKPKDLEVYKYWLEERGEKADPSFDPETFEKKVDMEFKKAIAKIDDKMTKIKKEVETKNHFSYRDVQNVKSELSAMQWMGTNSAYIQKTYIPFLKKMVKKMEAKRSK
jgi:hypothetical protein